MYMFATRNEHLLRLLCEKRLVDVGGVKVIVVLNSPMTRKEKINASYISGTVACLAFLKPKKRQMNMQYEKLSLMPPAYLRRTVLSGRNLE